MDGVLALLNLHTLSNHLMESGLLLVQMLKFALTMALMLQLHRQLPGMLIMLLFLLARSHPRVRTEFHSLLMMAVVEGARAILATRTCWSLRWPGQIRR